MKQGSGRSTRAGGKTEPRSHAVSMDRASNIGLKQARTTAPSPLMKGPGLKPGTTGSSRHPSGSQGKHR